MGGLSSIARTSARKTANASLYVRLAAYHQELDSGAENDEKKTDKMFDLAIVRCDHRDASFSCNKVAESIGGVFCCYGHVSEFCSQLR